MSQDPYTRYGDLLRQVKLRTVTVHALLREHSDPPPVFVIEEVALHLRMSLELIVLSSLLTKHAELARVSNALHRHDYKEARKLARRANASYWPVPTELDRSTTPPAMVELDPTAKPYLREEDWGAEWGFCSSILHASNPYAPNISTEQVRAERWRRLNRLSLRLVHLLNHHHVHVDDGSMLVGQMHAVPEGGDVSQGDVQVVTFVQAESDDPRA